MDYKSYKKYGNVIVAQRSDYLWGVLDHEGNEITPGGIVPLYDTGCPYPTFGIVKPTVTNTRVDMGPYGQSVFADAVDAIQAVDLTFDALVSEIDLSKMRNNRIVPRHPAC